MTTTPDENRGRDEIQAGVAVLTTVYQKLAGQITYDEAGSILASIADEHYPVYPVELVLPVATVALRALSMAAQALGTDVPALLRDLGGQAATLPDNDQA